MINHIKKFFENTMSISASDSKEELIHKEQMAAAALLIEVLKSDFEHRSEEWAAIDTALEELYSLSDQEISQIKTLAEEEVNKAISLHGFTRSINENYSSEEKLRIVEMLWRVVLADGVIDKHENHIMRKIGALLYIPHKDYISAKQQARLHRL